MAQFLIIRMKFIMMQVYSIQGPNDKEHNLRVTGDIKTNYIKRGVSDAITSRLWVKLFLHAVIT